MMMRNVAVGLVCALALAACDKPASESEAPPAAATGSTLTETLPNSLSAEEVANFQVALAQLPAGAVISHAVAEGPSVALHYTATNAEGATAGLQFMVFDANHAITENNRTELLTDPRPHLAGATFEGPAATDTAVEVTNKQAVLAFFQALTQGRVDSAASRIADNVSEYTGAGAIGKAAWLTAIRAEPARQYGVQRIAAWNDIVITYQSVGTTTPGGVQWTPGYDVFRLRDGKIVERWRLNY